MLHVHRADRADALVGALGELLAGSTEDPFCAEVVGVPTRGVERWLTQTLSTRLGASPSRHDGIVANVRFPTPREITDGATAAVLGIDPATDPWARERLVWPLLEVVDAHLTEPWLAILAEHLRDSAGIDDQHACPRRLVTVRHLAHLFDRYALHRPTMLRRWSGGEDVDGSGQPLRPHAVWQAALWRHLRERIATPDPAERLTDAIARLQGDTTPLDLPTRLSLFGLTRLPPGQLDVLRSIAAARDVHLFVLHPSPALWAGVATVLDEHGATIHRRADDSSATLPQNSLLGSWGRDARELQLVFGPAAGYADHPLCSSDREAASLLRSIQAAVRDNRRPPGPPLPGQPDVRPLLDAADRSVELHACHGRARQVEILRDVILHALQDDPGLQPRDVIVMCPDIEAFAPLIQATFGVGDTALLDDDLGGLGNAENQHDPEDELRPPDLRVRLADRALRQSNPVLGTIGRLLELADQRLTASQVVDLVDRRPVRRRFNLDDDDLVRLGDWIARTEIRWGLDAAHRSPFKLDQIAANTWRAGLDRVLLGVTMTEDDQRLVGGVLPLDDVDSGAIDLAGRFAELLDRLQATIERFSQARSIEDWAAELATAADLLTATSERDGWQRAALDRLLADLVEDAAAAGPSSAKLELAELRNLLDEHLRGRPTRANFRTGHLTFCTLAPMRSIPHRVVCLLGLDDTVFPRRAPRDGDDLILDDPHVGDHDGRTEDRQMLLDALLAAQDKLVITHTGNDERTNAPQPPAVPVGELLDIVDRTVRSESGCARDAITVRHPLQPFDPRNFTPGKLAGAAPFSFDHVALLGARALTTPRKERPPFLSAPLPDPAAKVVELDDLVRFVQHPARAFLRQRFGVSLGTFSDELDDALPLDLDGLQQWAIGDRMLLARLAGHSIEGTVAAEQARGALPPGRLADAGVASLRRNVEAVVAAAAAELRETAHLSSLDVRVAIPGGRILSGTVAGRDEDRLQFITYSRIGPKHRLAAWVRLLALTAVWPDRPFEAVTIGRIRSGGRAGSTVSIVRIPPLGVDADSRRTAAVTHLGGLLDLYDRGLREPPPLACASSAAYAQAAATGRNAAAAGSKDWTSGWGHPREDQELEHRQLLGGIVSFDELVSEPPRTDEQGPEWDPHQASRFGRWAVRLWSGLLAAEQVTDR